ncbi:MAG: ROK family protein [Chloroflexi bacterium]|nr:ROK family protein [Chloroflexota bacterium]
MADERRIAIGVDVGGSGIKVAAVDLASGALASQRYRIATPKPSTPEAVIKVIASLVKRAGVEMGAPDLPVGVGLPSVILDGATMTAANIDKRWIGFAARDAMSEAVGRRVALGNDADVAGLAEIRFGVGATDPSVRRGVVIFLTLGTGVGSGVFNDGVLVPNTELGHMEIRGKDAEWRSSAAARLRRSESWKGWAEDLDEHLKAIDRLFWPRLFILGGGVSKQGDRFIPRLTCRPPVIAATLRNEAGIVGAALLAVDPSARAQEGADD